MKQLIQIMVFVFLISGCQSKNRERAEVYAVAKSNMDMSAKSEEAMELPPPPPPAPAEDISNAAENKNKGADKKKIIKDGRMGLKVSDLSKAKSKTDALVKAHGGYYESESLNNSDYEASYTLKVRIPGSNFEKFIAGIESEDGEIMYKTIDARDVTDQFIDLETRLNTKKNYLVRYNELLKKAQAVKDILEIEEKVRGLEEEIDSTIGRLKYLSDQVDYSTLDLTITKEKEFKYNPASRDSFVEKLKQSISKGWYGFVDFILFLFNIWPFLIITGILIYMWKRFKLKFRLRKKM
jgi:hypothetical protein